jgi:hypothetical protein
VTTTPTQTATPTHTSTPTPTQTPVPTATPTLTATATVAATVTLPAVPENIDDSPRPRTEEQRQQDQRTNAANLDQYRTEGNVTAVEPGPNGATLLVTIALGRGETLVLEVRCERGACPDVRIGDYVTAEGEQGGREEGGRFLAERLTVTR